MVGIFLGEFVEDILWVYLDIVGILEIKGVYDLGLVGVIGVMVCIFVIFVECFGEE